MRVVEKNTRDLVLVFTGICNLLGYAMLGLGLEIKTFLCLLILIKFLLKLVII